MDYHCNSKLRVTILHSEGWCISVDVVSVPSRGVTAVTLRAPLLLWYTERERTFIEEVFVWFRSYATCYWRGRNSSAPPPFYGGHRRPYCNSQGRKTRWHGTRIIVYVLAAVWKYIDIQLQYEFISAPNTLTCKLCIVWAINGMDIDVLASNRARRNSAYRWMWSLRNSWWICLLLFRKWANMKTHEYQVQHNGQNCSNCSVDNISILNDIVI